jgi:hypothetical protein
MRSVLASRREKVWTSSQFVADCFASAGGYEGCCGEIMNEPISYDDHGDIPLHVPFGDVRPADISIYLELNTKVGKNTCRQACAHCFFINQPEARNRSIDLREGQEIMRDLTALGYSVFPMISDSFANNGEFLRLFGNSHNRDYRQDMDRKLTKTMLKGELWTSGAPLLDDDWRDMLCLALENNFGSVTITFHGIVGEELILLPHEEYPIKGVFKGQDCVRVINRVASFNADMQAGGIERLRMLPQELRQPLQVNVGITIGQHNHRRQNLLRYIRFFDCLPVSVVRFNCFHDHGWLHPHLTLGPSEIAKFYRDLKWIHTNIPLNFQLGVDEDFGTSGIEVMGFPQHTGWCRAGRQLFAIVPDEPTIIEDNEEHRLENTGSVAGCVDAFKPIVGRLVRATDKVTQHAAYYIEFFHTVIDELTRKRLSGVYADGCFAAEMLAEERGLQQQRSVQVSRSLPVLINR